ncbi:MAG: transposase, partial [Rhodobacteraceae bacterium]|nr:transposase [Paracoccaceae bacterium]
MAARVGPDTGEATSKQRYRVKNWSEYDRSLVNRGNLTIGFDDTSIKDNWTPAPPVGRGKPGLYSETAIQTCLTIKALFQLPYRATEGLMKSLMRLCQLDLPVPDHTHVSRRAGEISVRIPRRPRKGPTHVVVDSTGLKIFGEGDVSQVSADGAYDTKACHVAIADRDARATSPPRDGAVPRGDDHPRDGIHNDIAAKGSAGWKNDSDYHRRSIAEN